MLLCSSLKGFAMRKHIRTSLTLLIVALAAASFMLVLPGCAGGSNDSPGKPDAVGNRSADGASEAAQGDVVSTAMVAYANGDQVLFVDQETQTPYIPTEIDDATIIVDGQQTDEEALVAGNIVQVTGNGIMLESYPGQYPGITKGRSHRNRQPRRRRAVRRHRGHRVRGAPTKAKYPSAASVTRRIRPTPPSF